MAHKYWRFVLTLAMITIGCIIGWAIGYEYSRDVILFHANLNTVLGLIAINVILTIRSRGTLPLFFYICEFCGFMIAFHPYFNKALGPVVILIVIGAIVVSYFVSELAMILTKKYRTSS